MWEISKYKGLCTCLNQLMNRDHRQLDILYICTMINPISKALVRAEVSRSYGKTAIVAQITGLYLCTNRKTGWPSIRRSLTCWVIGRNLILCYPRIWRLYGEKIVARLLCDILRITPLVIQSNSNAYSGVSKWCNNGNKKSRSPFPNFAPKKMLMSDVEYKLNLWIL